MKKRFLLIGICSLAVVVGGCAAGKTENLATPTATVAAYYESTAKKDFDRLKGLLSKATVADIDAMEAKLGKGRFYETLGKNVDKDPKRYKTAPETRNEQINGESASLEIKDPNNTDWDKMYFARENGQWKIDLLKTMEEIGKSK